MSTFTYDPKKADVLLPDGDYEAVVYEAEHTVSHKGNPMLEITVKAYGPDGLEPLAPRLHRVHAVRAAQAQAVLQRPSAWTSMLAK